MFKGTTIEELINSVCRAEEHARRERAMEEQQAAGIPAMWEQQYQAQELVEVG